MSWFSETSEATDGKWVSGSLTASDTAGALFSWQNKEGVAVIVDSVLVDVTTAATSGTATVDIGYTATSAATSADNLIDGADVSTNAIVYNNIVHAGTHGSGAYHVAAGKWITASQKTGALAGIAGRYYLHYRRVRT